MSKHANNWDNRYDDERYFYGKEPNYLLARVLPDLTPGRALFLAEGEGRNAVYAAGLGFDVVAVDNSFVGQRKALALAVERGVELDYRLEDLVDGSWTGEGWDLIMLGFAHLPPETMGGVHAACVEALRPGGVLVLNSFAKAQFGRKSGGPPRLAWLHDLGELKERFAALDIEAVETEVELREGAGHGGSAVVIELVGRKARA